MTSKVLKLAAALLFIISFGYKAEAQRIIRYEYFDGDSLPVYEFDEAIIDELVDPKAREKYLNLVKNLKAVFPYAKMAAFRLQLMEDNARTLTGKERKEYIKQSEKAFKDEFSGYLKNLYRPQGQLLTKLVYRETGKTTYEILDEFTGPVETLLWSTTASVFGGDLKDTFDPMEDYQIEYIIKSLGLE